MRRGNFDVRLAAIVSRESALRLLREHGRNDIEETLKHPWNFCCFYTPLHDSLYAVITSISGDDGRGDTATCREATSTLFLPPSNLAAKQPHQFELGLDVSGGQHKEKYSLRPGQRRIWGHRVSELKLEDAADAAVEGMVANESGVRVVIVPDGHLAYPLKFDFLHLDIESAVEKIPGLATLLPTAH